MTPSGPPRRPRQTAESQDAALDELLAHIEGRRARGRQRLLRVDLGIPMAGRPGPAPEPGTGSGPGSGQTALRSGAAPGTVLSLQRPGPDLLRFTLARPAGFDYRPGQSVKLSVDGVARRYSMVSAPHEPHLEFFVELVPGGRMSGRLAVLRANDRIGIADRPKAGLALDMKARRHLMLATVTGVNPFVSILRDALHQGRHDLRAILVQGASFAEEFGYREELEALATARPDLLVYLPTVSRPGEARNAGWTGATGRADTQIAETVARSGLRPADTAAYACGNPGMVDIAQQLLTERGFTVRTERYSQGASGFA